MRKTSTYAALTIITFAGALWSQSPAVSTPSGCPITRREIDKQPWNSVMDPPAPEGMLVFPDTKAAIWLDKKQFTPGEPLKTWLAIKLLSQEPQRGMLLDVDLGDLGGKARFVGNTRIELRKLKDDGTSNLVAQIGGNPARAIRRLTVPPQGCFLNGGDLRNITGAPLTPGSYRVQFWAQGQRAEATFSIADSPSVAPATAESAASKPAPESALLHWSGSWTGLRKSPLPFSGIKCKLENGYVYTRTLDDFSKGLALGVGQGPEARHYARLKDLPQQDELLQISAKYIAGARARVEITLKPVATTTSQPAASASDRYLPLYPQIYLLVENLGTPARWNMDSDRYEPQQELSRVAFNSTVVLDVELPEGWVRRTGFTGQVRLSVVVTSDPVKYGLEPRYPVADNGQPLEQQGRKPQNEAKRWTGAVKSLPMDIPVKSE